LLEFRLAILYFSLTVFNNPSFNIVGLSPNEIFGSAAILVAIIKGGNYFKRHASLVVIGLFIAFTASALHALMAALVYPDLTPDFATIILKIAVNLKILVLAGNLFIIGIELKRGVGLSELIRSILASGTFALLIYMVQIFIFSIGIVPYGTYFDAGFIGIPSFGSVSIERGHFGKFITPYFPFFLYAFIAWKTKWRFLLYLVVGAINFSASSIFFFLYGLFLSGLFFYRSWSRRNFFAISFFVITSVMLLLSYSNIYEGIVEKIITIAVQGDESQGGGRSFGLFLEYINAYPFGMGYSGSTLRTAPLLPEINAAYFAFLAQYSLLSFPLLFGFAFIWLNAIRLGSNQLIYRCFNIGVLMAPIIFATDILWFLPLIWLSMEINLSAKITQVVE